MRVCSYDSIVHFSIWENELFHYLSLLAAYLYNEVKKIMSKTIGLVEEFWVYRGQLIKFVMAP